MINSFFVKWSSEKEIFPIISSVFTAVEYYYMCSGKTEEMVTSAGRKQLQLELQNMNNDGFNTDLCGEKAHTGWLHVSVLSHVMWKLAGSHMKLMHWCCRKDDHQNVSSSKTLHFKFIFSSHICQGPHWK